MPHHSQDLFNEYKGKDKYLEIIKGGHNSIRPRKLVIKICNFLYKHLKENENEEINEKESEMIIENDNNDEDDDDRKNEDSFIQTTKNIFKLLTLKIKIIITSENLMEFLYQNLNIIKIY